MSEPNLNWVSQFSWNSRHSLCYDSMQSWASANDKWVQRCMWALANGRTTCWEVWRGTKRLSNCVAQSFVHWPSVSLNKFICDAFSLKVEFVFYKEDNMMICCNCEHWYAVAVTLLWTAVQLVLCFFAWKNYLNSYQNSCQVIFYYSANRLMKLY